MCALWRRDAVAHFITCSLASILLQRKRLHATYHGGNVGKTKIHGNRCWYRHLRCISLHFGGHAYRIRTFLLLALSYKIFKSPKSMELKWTHKFSDFTCFIKFYVQNIHVGKARTILVLLFLTVDCHFHLHSSYHWIVYEHPGDACVFSFWTIL